MRPCRYCWIYRVPLMLLMGLLLFAASLSAQAETQPAQNTVVIGSYMAVQQSYDTTCTTAAQTALSGAVGQQYASTALAQSGVFSAAPSLQCGSGGTPESVTLSTSGVHNTVRVMYRRPGTSYTMFVHIAYSSQLMCPDNTWTLSGTTCTRPEQCPKFGTPEGDTAPSEKPSNCECPAGTLWVPMNGCRKRCESYQSQQDVFSPGTYIFGSGDSVACQGGCEIQPSADSEHFEYGDGSRTFMSLKYTGWACNTPQEPTKPQTPVPDTAPEEPTKPNPKCPTAQGVLTSSSGTVACVPSAPDSPPSRKPEYDVTKKTSTYPDNSVEVVVTTKTKDPATNASHTHTLRTCTGGMCGPAGTTSSEEGSSQCVGEKCDGTSDGDSGGDGNGDGEGDGDGGDGGGFGGPEGTLYEKKGKTFSDVMNTFKNTVQSAPFFQFSTNFFQVSMGGSCGGLSATIPYLNTTISLDDAICGANAQMILAIAGAVVFAIAAFAAFKIAIL